MTREACLDRDSQQSVLHWAVQRGVAINVSLLSNDRWCSLRSQFLRFDPDQNLLQIAYPVPTADSPPAEVVPGDRLGLSFRRGHKKCIFLSLVVMRRPDTTPEGIAIDTLLIRVPGQVRSLQRRAYQRVDVPGDRFIAVKICQGGPCAVGETAWPLCSGRLGNISVGGILVDVRADQNPRLGVGDTVGLEITASQGLPPLLAEAQYRHCTITGPGRIGLGMRFLGLEHEISGRASIMQVADFVKSLQRLNSRNAGTGRR